MKTKTPKKLVQLMKSMQDAHSVREASARRHIKITTSKTKSGGRLHKLNVSATGKAEEAIMWLDAGFVGTPDYMGMSWFWHYEYRHYMRGATYSQRRRVHAAFLKSGLPVDGESDEHEAIVRKLTATKGAR
jgi:cellulose synthase/poly-beta-1,6-N-acetylglucosamine synthase-like glycosyltransferase